MQETHATLSQEVFAEIPSYSSMQRIIQRRNLKPIQNGPANVTEAVVQRCSIEMVFLKLKTEFSVKFTGKLRLRPEAWNIIF